MTSLFGTLSTSYVRRHPGKTLLAVLGVAVGVMAFVAVSAAQESLTAGLRATVDRLAGATDLELTGPGGVPEAVRDRVRDLDVVDAEAPVIEQVVQPVRAGLGSLLVVGVDLVGDRLMRTYTFAGDDADIDDPLEFLAQPDSVALSRPFATRAGLHKGDRFEVRVGGLTKALTVRAILDGTTLADAYGGNVAVTDIYAAETLCGRGRRFDRVDLRVRPGLSMAQAATTIETAVGPGYQLAPPAARGAELSRVAEAVVHTFDIVTMLAFGLGLFLIVHVLSLGVERRRRDIGILRTSGATPRQVSWLFLGEGAVLGLVGGLLGVWLGSLAAGRLHEAMSAALQAVHGLGDETPSTLSPVLVIEGFGVALGGALIGAWVPARRAAAIPPIASTSTGTFAATAEPLSGWAAGAGAVALAVAWWLSRAGASPDPRLLPVVMTLGVLGMTGLAGRLAHVVVRAIAPGLTWLAPAAGRIAANTLRTRPRRTAGRAAVLIITAGLALGIGGFLRAVRGSIDGWVGGAVLSDVVVRASPGFGVSSVHLAADLPARLATVPGITAVDVVRTERVAFLGRSVTLMALDGGGVVAHALADGLVGDARAVAHLAAAPDTCVVSDVFARRFGLALGAPIILESPTGPVALRITGLIPGFRATVLIDRSVFTGRWADDRIDTAYLTVARGTDPAAVREDLRARLGDTPALVSTRPELVAAWNRTLHTLDVATLATICIALAVAVLGSAASLALSAAERASEAGILRAIGATPHQIAGASVLEALSLTVASLAWAVPCGAALAWFLRAHVADLIANVRLPAVYPTSVLVVLAVLLPVVAVAATWLPLERASIIGVTEAMSYE